LRIANIVGARPQFIKAAAVRAALRDQSGVTDILIHTGQHYDSDMSDVHFAQLGLEPPDVELGIGSGSHGEQTGQMMIALEGPLRDLGCDFGLVYGDTNTTLAGALVAAKLGMPIGHVEAGLRSYNRSMPEEINRISADRVSEVLFCPTQTAVDNLVREGITRGVVLTGDVMADLLVASRTRARFAVLGELGVRTGSFSLLTLHRAANTDDPMRLSAILRGVARLPHPVVFPVHPRTRAAIAAAGLEVEGNLAMISPVGYLESLALQMHSRTILTDSGGMQKEAYLLGVPCVTLREETEWPETVAAGWNTLVGASTEAIAAAADRLPPDERPPLYGDGRAAHAIAAALAAGPPWGRAA
jgi:UDP-N-acetylglucosamine 2-epimerase